MTLELVIDGDLYEVEIDEEGEHAYQVRVDGEPFEVLLEPTDEGILSATAGQQYGIQRKGRILFVDGERVDVGVQHLATARMGAGRSAGGEITPPMPGRIVEILVDEGDEVQAGAPLLVLEAMKMQNEITAPGPSRVAEIRVSEGQAVEASDVLLVLEPA